MRAIFQKKGKKGQKWTKYMKIWEKMYKILKYFVKGQVISRYKLLEKALEPKPPYILVKLFNMCLKEYCFQIVGRFHLWSLYLRISGKDLQLKTTTLLVFFLSKNLRIISLLIILRNMAFLFPLAFQVFLIKYRFSDSLYLLIGVGLGILVSILQSQVIWDFVCQVFTLFSPFLSYRQHQVVLDGKSS